MAAAAAAAAAAQKTLVSVAVDGRYLPEFEILVISSENFVFTKRLRSTYADQSNGTIVLEFSQLITSTVMLSTYGPWLVSGQLISFGSRRWGKSQWRWRFSCRRDRQTPDEISFPSPKLVFLPD